jgi:hypothetical protein
VRRLAARVAILVLVAAALAEVLAEPDLVPGALPVAVFAVAAQALVFDCFSIVPDCLHLRPISSLEKHVLWAPSISTAIGDLYGWSCFAGLRERNALSGEATQQGLSSPFGRRRMVTLRCLLDRSWKAARDAKAQAIREVMLHRRNDS